MERVLTVEFGPSRSKRFAQAVEEARGGAGECSELELGRRYRVRFVLGSDGDVYKSLARLLQRVRNWRATEVYEGDQLVSSDHVRDITPAVCPTSDGQNRTLRKPHLGVRDRFDLGVTASRRVTHWRCLGGPSPS